MVERERGERDVLMEALMDLIIERGYEGFGEVEIVRLAGLDHAAFERHFTDKADCYEQTYLRNYAVFDRLVFGAFESHEGWREGLRAAAYAAARYLRDHGREVLVGTVPATDCSAAHRDRSFQRLVDIIDAGRQGLHDPGLVSRGVAEGTLGSIYETLVRRLGEGKGARSAESFVPELMYIAVRPYLGHDIAREELSIPPPPEFDPPEGGA